MRLTKIQDAVKRKHLARRNERVNYLLRTCKDCFDLNQSSVSQLTYSMYCSGHQVFHCPKHATCFFSKIRYSDEERVAFLSHQKYKSNLTSDCKRGDIELCKILTWWDQITFKILKCAECKSTVCKCDPAKLIEKIKLNQVTKKNKNDKTLDSIPQEFWKT